MRKLVFFNQRLVVHFLFFKDFQYWLHLCLFYILSLAPDPVSNITAENISSRHIYLSWTQPCHPNGNIANYTIEVTNLNESSNAGDDIRFTNNSSTSFNVTGLLPYRSYNFTVRTQVAGVLQLSDPQNSIFQTSTEGIFILNYDILSCYW